MGYCEGLGMGDYCVYDYTLVRVLVRSISSTLFRNHEVSHNFNRE